MNEVEFEEAKRNGCIKSFAKDNQYGFSNPSKLIQSWIDAGIAPDDEHKISVFTISNSCLGGTDGRAHQQIIKIQNQFYYSNHKAIWQKSSQGKQFNGIMTNEDFSSYIEYVPDKLQSLMLP